MTAGYGLEKSLSYPALLQQALDERGYNYEVVNAGVSGETTTGGLRRIDRFLDDDVQIVIVELGANDGLRGLPVRDLRANLEAIIEKAQSKNITVVLAGMEAPPHLGPEYTNEFRQAFRDVAEEHDVPLIPFFLDGVAGSNDLNQMDGIHPNARGTAIVADNVLSVVEPLLAK